MLHNLALCRDTHVKQHHGGDDEMTNQLLYLARVICSLLVAATLESSSPTSDYNMGGEL